MRFNEFKGMTYDVSNKIIAINTFASLLKLALEATSSISDREERLPDIEHIADTFFMLAGQAHDAAEKLVMEFPSSMEGIAP